MGGFLGQAHPHAVLLVFLRSIEGKIGHGKEQGDHYQLDVGKVAQLRNQQRFLVVDVALAAIPGIDLDRLAFRLHFGQHRIQVILAVFRDVAGGQDPVLVIDQNNGHRFILLHYLEQEFGIICGADLFLGFGPEADFLALGLAQLLGQVIGVQQRGDADGHRCQQQGYFPEGFLPEAHLTGFRHRTGYSSHSSS